MVIPKEGENVAPGMPIVRIAGSGNFKITADIAESNVGNIRNGNNVMVNMPDLSKSSNVTIKSIGQEINPMSRTFKIETGLGGLESVAKANMIVYLKIEDYKNPSVITIPINVVQTSNEGDFVYIDDAKVAVKKLVKTGRNYMGVVEILSGLAIGDKLIIVAYQELMDGQPLKY